MEQKIGVWIDSQRAVVITLANGESSLKTILSGIEGKIREEGEGKDYARFGIQYTNNEKKNAIKHQIQAVKFSQDVVEELNGCEEFVVFGPAQMKLELKKVIDTNPIIAKKLVDVIPADNMTDKQLIAWVKDYFKN
ncbi:MAG: hypothetical protein HYU68_12030 [Bacteroidetes bacterium]|nr:hypothetical protein [Bacteroidota bacterium]